MEVLKARFNKILFPVLLFSLISITAKAWERRSDSSLFISGHADILYTQLKNHLYGDDFSPGFGYGYGLDAYFTQWQEFGFSAGLNFNSRQFSIDDNILIYNNSLENIGSTRAKYQLNYLAIPLTARYNFGQRFNVYADVGMRLNILLSAKKYADTDSLPETANPADTLYMHDIKDDFRNFSFGLQFGGGVEYYFKPTLAVYADYKYILDISQMYVYERLYGGIKPKMFAHSLQVGIRYAIPIKYSVNERFR
ncbi:MAG: porin family protein [Bacteroidota bacterium]